MAMRVLLIWALAGAAAAATPEECEVRSERYTAAREKRPGAVAPTAEEQRDSCEAYYVQQIDRFVANAEQWSRMYNDLLDKQVQQRRAAEDAAATCAPTAGVVYLPAATDTDELRRIRKELRQMRLEQQLRAP